VKKLLTTRNLIILALVVALFAVSSLLGLKVVQPEVSIAAEPIFHIGSFAITNSLFTAWITMILLVVLAWLATRQIPRNLEQAPSSDLAPKSAWQNFVEWMVEGFYGMTQSAAGSWARQFFPIVMSIFLFVIVSNWLGLLPGFGSIGVLEPAHTPENPGYVANGALLTAARPAAGQEGYILVPLFRPASTDLNFTLALALTAVALTQYFGIKAQKAGYFRKFINTSGFKNGAVVGIAEFFAGILEIVSEFAKIISFSFRLFGNIFAGEVLLGVIAFLIPYVASLPFYGLEVFVGFIQALVFMMLALVFFTVATIGHGSEAHH
jgi:F-type H+-transporting ATPase subunit a